MHFVIQPHSFVRLVFWVVYEFCHPKSIPHIVHELSFVLTAISVSNLPFSPETTHYGIANEFSIPSDLNSGIRAVNLSIMELALSFIGNIPIIINFDPYSMPLSQFSV